MFPCIQIFKGFFWLKSVKSVCICDYDKDRIVTWEKCVFHFELGHKRKSGPGSPKTHGWGVTKTIKNETKEQNVGFLSILLGTLGASLLGNLLTGKGIVRAGTGNNSLNKKGKWFARAGTQNKKEWDF